MTIKKLDDLRMNSPNISSLFKSQKTVGLRAFFPDLPSHMSTYEKAKIWVKRHNNNYYIGWSEEQLQTLDPIVRPLTVITTQLYKRHMNRSEFGRITKLKFCLESDADWAQEFREKLMERAHDGGFKSLGEAKIAATELWRKHSELYDVQRARIAGSNKTGDRTRSISSSDNTPPKRLCPSGPHSMISSLSDIHNDNSEGETGGSLNDSLSFTEASDNYPSILRSESISNTDETNSQMRKVDRTNMKSLPCGNKSELQDCCVFDTSIEDDEKSSLFPDVFSLPITVREKMEILLQRQKHNFFKDWSNDQLTLLNENVQPIRMVTDDTYRGYLASDEGQFTTFLCNILQSEDENSQMLRDMLFSSFEIDSCTNWRDVEIHVKNIVRKQEKIGQIDTTRFDHDSDFHSTPHSSISDHNRSLEVVCHDATEIKKPRSAFRSSWPLTPIDRGPISRSKSDIATQRKLYQYNTPEVGVGSDAKDGTILKAQHETRRTTLKQLSGNLNKRMNSDTVGDKPSQEYSSRYLSDLWSLRSILVEQCTEEPGTSWHDKLRPHLLLIRAHLGETYTLPSTVAECIADLTLVTLHKALSSSGCSATDCSD